MLCYNIFKVKHCGEVKTPNSRKELNYRSGAEFKRTPETIAIKAAMIAAHAIVAEQTERRRGRFFS